MARPAAAQTGEVLRASYTLRNSSRMPKLWLEVRIPSTLPVEIPGRALSLGSTASSVVGTRAADAPRPLPHRPHGHPHRRPVGLFESGALSAGRPTHRLPGRRTVARWRCRRPHRGHAAHAKRTPHMTPLVTGCGRTCRASHSIASTGSPAPARRSCRSRSSTSSRPPTCGCSSTWSTAGRLVRGDELTPRIWGQAGGVDSRPRTRREPQRRPDCVRRAHRAAAARSRRPAVSEDHAGSGRGHGRRRQSRSSRCSSRGSVGCGAGCRRSSSAPSLERTWVRPLTGLRARGVETVGVAARRSGVCCADARRAWTAAAGQGPARRRAA